MCLPSRYLAIGLSVTDDCVNSIYSQQVVSAVLGEIYSTGCVQHLMLLLSSLFLLWATKYKAQGEKQQNKKQDNL
jgi:hypothetical protein